MLIFYANPNHKGHCGYALKHLLKQLENQKTSYKLIDLYKERYNPVMQLEEHYTSGGSLVAKDTKKYQETIKEAEQIVFIYPTWWNGTPAILKGFFDRTLTKDFAFNFNKQGLPIGHLKGKAAVITTTGGSVLVEKLFLGNRSLKTVTKDTLGFCGLRAKGFMIGGSKRFSDDSKLKIEQQVDSALRFLN